MPERADLRYRWSWMVLPVAIVALYGLFLSSPLVFDDLPFFATAHPESLQKVFGLELRWLSYVTFEWGRDAADDNLIWLRSGNLALHVANALLLFHFLRRLFDTVVPAAAATAGSGFARRDELSLSSAALCGALVFALHPAAVYGVAYLIQRTILMATLFALLAWLLFLEGLVKHRQGLLLASAAAYFAAVLSKEHAIMVPAVSGALFVLAHHPDRASVGRVAPAALLYALVGAFVILRIRSGNVLGNTYEPNRAVMLTALAVDPGISYPLSIVTQCYLFFKYLFLWVVPIPSLMSIDIREELASRFWTWPHTAGAFAFVVYAILASHCCPNTTSSATTGP